jgi:pimeloyl-ACP methyl ester carboxylesterase
MTTRPEQIFPLPNGRQIAYVSAGNPESKTLIIFYHGMFGVGRASEHTPGSSLATRDVHFLAPTLHGWGLTSPSLPGSSFVETLLADMRALLDHLYPSGLEDVEIHVAGGSYGSAPAQILYGASYDLFPPGRRIKGLIVMAGFAPFHYHKDYATGLPWESWVGVGPPAVMIPFKLVQRVTKLLLAPKLQTVEGSEVLARKILFDGMDGDERQKYAAWRARDPVNRGTEPGVLERQFGEMMHKSVRCTWEGYFDVVPVLHADWGFDPRKLDDEHTRGKRVLVVSGKKDWRLPQGAGAWLIAAYKNARLREVEGGHLSGLWEMDSIWADYFGDEV